MRLTRLIIKNFKGCKSLTLEPNGCDIAIYGDNATGKTTIADALYWLLFGKDSFDKSDFGVKPFDEGGNEAHNLTHSVAATFTKDDGKTLELSREMVENWARPRNRSEQEFTGHTTTYAVDQVPTKAREFEDVVCGLVPGLPRSSALRYLRCLVDPMAFNTFIPWAERRKLLVEIYGDVSDDDILESSRKLAELKEAIGSKSVADFRKVTQQSREDANKQLDVLPGQIAAVRDSLSTEVRVHKDASQIEATLKEHREELITVRTGGALGDALREMSELDAALRERRLQLRTSQVESSKLNDALNADVTAQTLLTEARAKVKSLETAKVASGARFTELLADHAAVTAEQFDEASLVCPACKRPFAEDSAITAREAFNIAKSEKLAKIVADGKAAKVKVTEIDASLEVARKALAEAEQSFADTSFAVVAARKEAGAIPDGSDDPECQRLSKAIEDQQNKISAIRESSVTAIDAVEAKITAAEAELKEIVQFNATVDAANKARESITTLESKERQLASTIDYTSKMLDLCDEFTRIKVSALSEKINARFKVAQFRLFENFINGNLNEVCETMVNGVPWGDLNHGARVNAGLDIINTLADHFGGSLPVVIDNQESVTTVTPTGAQQIRLIVSASDKELRVEYPNE